MNKEKRKFNKVIKDRRRHERYLRTRRQGVPRKRKVIERKIKLSWWQRLKNWVLKKLKSCPPL